MYEVSCFSLMVAIYSVVCGPANVTTKQNITLYLLDFYNL